MNVQLEGIKSNEQIELRIRAEEGDGFNLIIRSNGQLKFEAVDSDGKALPFRELFNQIRSTQ